MLVLRKFPEDFNNYIYFYDDKVQTWPLFLKGLNLILLISFL